MLKHKFLTLVLMYSLAMLLVVQGSIIAGLALAGRARQTLPAGLSLR